jgi:sugar lactone lactonase YvrE
MRRLVITLALGVILLVALAAPAGATTMVWQPSTLATFSTGDYGAFAAGMAADSHGNLIGSLTTWGYYDEQVDPSLWGSNIGQIWKVTPKGQKRLISTKNLSPNGTLLGVAVDAEDQVYVALGGGGTPPTIDSAVLKLGPNGKLTEVVKLPDGTFPNSLAFHGGRLYITDSFSGAVWSVRLAHGVSEPAAPWLQDTLLAPADPATDPTAMGLGANGIAFRGDRAYVSVSDYGRIVSVPVRADGSAGSPKVFCERPELVTADGIAFDARDRLWVATNSGTTGVSPSGALYRISTSGALTQLTDDPGWLNYPCMPVFGTTMSTSRTLFIVNGAFWSGYGDGTAPDIQAVPVDVAGLPLN